MKYVCRPTFIRIWKKGSVEQYSSVPYVATLLNCMMWVLYGLPAVHPHSMLVITINGTGMAIELTYIALFLAFSLGAVRRRVLLLLAAEVAFVAAVAALVLNLAHTHERRSMIVGILCVLFGTGMYAAPLSVMVRSITLTPPLLLRLTDSLVLVFNFNWMD
jgi:solute carrier family 50 protein (sugar transporter)